MMEITFDWQTDSLGKLIEDIDELRAHLETIGGPTAAAARHAEAGGGNIIYIDFSDSLRGQEQCDRMVELLRDWWQIPLEEKVFSITGVWGENWILVLDKGGWEDYMEASKSVESTGMVLRGKWHGEDYPVGKKDTPAQRRSYCFVDWWGAAIDAGAARTEAKSKLEGFKEDIEAGALEEGYGEDTEVPEDGIDMSDFDIKGEDRIKRLPPYVFLTWPGVWEEIFTEEGEWNDELFQDAHAKIAAWYAAHELSHALWFHGELPHKESFFDVRIKPLEILIYYTETGRKLLYDDSPIVIKGTETNKVDLFYKYLGKVEGERYWYEEYKDK
jgi:hypothetical protein